MSKISFTKKPIENLEADILFCYNNSDLLWNTSGVGKKLLELDKSGEVQRDCSRISSRKIGSALLLSAGELPFKAICHLIISGLANDPTESSLMSAIRWGLSLASEQRYSTLILPTLDPGPSGMPLGLAANVLIREAVVHSQNKFVEKITVCSLSNKEHQAYTAAHRRMK